MSDATIMQWQTRWKSLLDPLLKSTSSSPVNLQLSPSSGNHTIPATGLPVPVADATVTLTTTGNPVSLSIVAPTTPTMVGIDSAFIWTTTGVTGASDYGFAEIILLRNGAQIFSHSYAVSGAQGAGNTMTIPSCTTDIDLPSAGKYDYSIAIAVFVSGNYQFSINEIALSAYELGT